MWKQTWHDTARSLFVFIYDMSRLNSMMSNHAMGDTDDSLLDQSSTYSIANGTFNRNANVTIGSVEESG